MVAKGACLCYDNVSTLQLLCSYPCFTFVCLDSQIIEWRSMTELIGYLRKTFRGLLFIDEVLSRWLTWSWSAIGQWQEKMVKEAHFACWSGFRPAFLPMRHTEALPSPHSFLADDKKEGEPHHNFFNLLRTPSCCPAEKGERKRFPLKFQITTKLLNSCVLLLKRLLQRCTLVCKLW